MGLGVTLYGESNQVECMCPHCGNDHKRTDRVEHFSANITHNLNTMADKAGIYKYLWRPEEIGITKAKQLIHPLMVGLEILKANPVYYKKFNAENGWGVYENLVNFVEKYLEACQTYPDADVEVDR